MTIGELRKIKDVPSSVFLLSSELLFIDDFGIEWEDGITLIQDNMTNHPLELFDFLEETKPCPNNMNIVVRTKKGRIVEGSLSLCDKSGFFKNL